MKVMIDLFGFERQRGQDLSRMPISLTRRLHADYLVDLPIQANLAAHNVRVGCELLSPEAIAYDDHVIITGFALFRQEITAHKHRIAEHTHKSRGLVCAVDLLGPFRTGQIESGS